MTGKPNTSNGGKRIPHVITRLCLRDNGCADVCPVECTQPGTPVEQWPTYYIDPAACIDCGECVSECPFSTIFPDSDVPAVFQAAGGELLNRIGLRGHHEAVAHHGGQALLESTGSLSAGETVNLREAIAMNREFFR